MVLLFWSFAVVYIFCDGGEMFTAKFQDFNDELEKCDWYTFPIKFQRMHAILLVNAQQTVNIHGFGNILLTRDVMKKVIF